MVMDRITIIKITIALVGNGSYTYNAPRYVTPAIAQAATDSGRPISRLKGFKFVTFAINQI